MRMVNAKVPLLSLGNTQLSYNVRALYNSEELSILLCTQIALVTGWRAYIFGSGGEGYCSKYYTGMGHLGASVGQVSDS